MATGTPYLTECHYKQAILWNWDEFFSHNQQSTGALVYYYSHDDNSFTHSGVKSVISLENKDILRKIQSTNDNRYIRLELSCKEQISSLKDVFEEDAFYSYRYALSNSLSSLLSLNPDKITLQVTREKSLFYTLIKDNLKVYFEHFLAELEEDEDEAIITIYQNNLNVLTFGGSLTEAFSKVENIVAPAKQVNIELVDELSY